jgi:hypothetical protein
MKIGWRGLMKNQAYIQLNLPIVCWYLGQEMRKIGVAFHPHEVKVTCGNDYGV